MVINTDLLKKIGKYVLYALIIATCIYGIKSVYNDFTEVPNYVAPDTGVSEGFVKDVLKSESVKDPDKQATVIYKEIERIKEVEKPPNYYAPVGTSEEDIKEILKKDNGDLAITEKNANSKPGTNIYSVHLDHSEHGIGVYVGGKVDPGEVSTSYGVHYRNKRWVYNVGIDTKGGVDARVAYEVIQW